MKMKNLQTKHGKWVNMGRQTDYMFEKKKRTISGYYTAH